MEHINLKTIDGLNLSALLWDRGGKTSVLLLHMMPATKESWEDFAEELYSKGFNVLALDFRGHGESEGVPYKSQKPEEIQKYFLDARAGLNFLEEKYHHTNFVVAGASIGANIALQVLAHDHAITTGICLSAGLDYYGVKANDFVQELSLEQSVLFVASLDDGRKGGSNCGEMANDLYESASCKKQKIIYDTGGHGTNLFVVEPALVSACFEFIKKSPLV